MSGNYETVTVMTLIPTDSIKPIHRLLLGAMHFEIHDNYGAAESGASLGYIYGDDPVLPLQDFELDVHDDDAEITEHSLYQLAYSKERQLDLPDILQDILKGLDPAQYAHIDVMAGYHGDRSRQGEHGGWSTRIYRDSIKHETTVGLFNEWDTEDQRITDLERMCLALNGHHDPKVAAAVARISDYITNHPALADEDDAPEIAPPSLETAVEALQEANCEVNGHGIEVMTALVASTGHVTAEENDMLCLQQDCPGENLSVAMEGEYGWTFYIGDGVSDYARGLSEGFAGAINYARSLGFDWLRLDSDAPSLPGVTTYEW